MKSGYNNMEKCNKVVSIVIPIFNVEKYLERCIESVINQTYKNLDIILVDDGSPDNCPKICDEYKKKDKRIKVIHKKNGGLSDARNCGMKIIKGDYLFFLDSDDYIPENAIEILLNIAIKNSSDIVVGKYLEFSNDNILKKNKDDEYEVENFDCKTSLQEMMYMHKIANSACGKIYKKSLFENIEYPKGKLMEDLGTTYKVFAKSKVITYTDFICYYYLVNNKGSIMNSNFKLNKLDGVKFAIEELNFMKQFNDDELVLAAKYRLYEECMVRIGEVPRKNKDIINNLYKYIINYRRDVVLNNKLYFKQRLYCLFGYTGILGIKLAYFIRKIL